MVKYLSMSLVRFNNITLKGGIVLADQVIWGIHAGKTGDADNLFSQKKRIAIGWAKVGDLSNMKTRDDVKDLYLKVYPESKPMAVANCAGQLYRFVHEMKIGDLVAYPAKSTREVRIGKIVSGYQYRPEIHSGYPNQRKVEWLKTLPRTSFTQGVLYEMGSAMSLFQIKTYAEEILALFEGTQTKITTEDDETIMVVTADIEQQTRDFVIKQLDQKLKGHPFADFVAHLLEAMGYRTRVSPPGPDGGIDIIAHPDDLGFQPPMIKVQVKSGNGSIGEPTVSALYGKVSEREYGLMITLGTFTAQAKNFAFSKGNLRLIDGDMLVALVFQYYENLEARYKGIIPLKKVYVPEIVEDNENGT